MNGLPKPPPEPTRIVVTDVRIPIGSMVVLLLKLALAAIPALLVLGTGAALIWIILIARLGN